MEPIAHIHTDFTSKFGVPRQAGLVRELQASIIFAPEYRNPEALRGLDGFSHLWLIWEFSQCVGKPWSPTVRPPRLGGTAFLQPHHLSNPFSHQYLRRPPSPTAPLRSQISNAACPSGLFTTSPESGRGRRGQGTGVLRMRVDVS